MDRLSIWNEYLRRKVHLIACGGTALTLLGIKDSTKDIVLIVPDEAEHDYLLKILKDLGYIKISRHGWSSGDQFIFDIFRGDHVYTTGLLNSPLKEGFHSLVKEFSYLYLGVLNDYDLIITKIFRATLIDIEDCKALVINRGYIEWDELEKRFKETVSYDIHPEKLMENLEIFKDHIKDYIK